MRQAQRWEYLEVFASQLKGEWWDSRGRSGKLAGKASAQLAPVANDLGRQGWELATAVPFVAVGGTQAYSLLFKRPLPEAVDADATETSAPLADDSVEASAREDRPRWGWRR